MKSSGMTTLASPAANALVRQKWAVSPAMPTPKTASRFPESDLEEKCRIAAGIAIGSCMTFIHSTIVKVAWVAVSFFVAMLDVA